MNFKIHHDSRNQLFYSDLANGRMTLEYTTIKPGLIDFTSTFVPRPYRNRGLGRLLVETGLHYADEHSLQVKTTCPFVAEYLKAHAKYRKLVAT